MEEVDYVTINKLTEGGESPGESDMAGLEAGFVLAAGIQTSENREEHHHTNNKLAEGGESPREIEMARPGSVLVAIQTSENTVKRENSSDHVGDTWSHQYSRCS